MRCLIFYTFILLAGCTFKSRHHSTEKNVPDDLLTVSKEGKWGLYSIENGWFVEPVYQKAYYARKTRDGLLKLRDTVNNQYTFYNTSYKKLFNVEADFVDDYLYDFAYYSLGEEAGFIDKKGTKVFTTNFSSLKSPENINGLVTEHTATNIRVIDLYQQRAIYQSETLATLLIVSDSLSIATTDSLYGIFNFRNHTYLKAKTTGRISYRRKDLNTLHQDPKSAPVFLLYERNEAVMIDSKGDTISDRRFNHVFSFADSLAYYRVDSKYGIIKLNGDEVIPPVYEKAVPSLVRSSEYFAFGNNEGFGVIDHTGKTVIPFEYQETGIVNDSLFIYKMDNLYGLKSLDSHDILPPIYDYLYTPYKSAYIIAEKDGKKGLIDLKGRVVLPLAYDDIIAE